MFSRSTAVVRYVRICLCSIDDCQRPDCAAQRLQTGLRSTVGGILRRDGLST